MDKTTKAVFIIIILTLPLALGLGGSPRPAREQASAEEARLLNSLAALTQLRDKVAGNWTLSLKYGSRAFEVLDDPYGTVKTKNIEQDLAALETLFASDPTADRTKAERLIQSLREISPAEKKYAESQRLLRNGAANILLGFMHVMILRTEVANEADAIVLGVRPMEILKPQSGAKIRHEAPDPEALKSWLKSYEDRSGASKKVKPPLAEGLEKGSKAPPSALEKPQDAPGRKDAPSHLARSAKIGASPAIGPEILETPDAILLPGPREPRLPSSDPEMLRLAYEAFQACRQLSYLMENTTNSIQLALYEEDQSTFFLFKPDPESAERALKTMSRLPGLTEAQLRAIGKQPRLFQDTAELVNLFEEHLQERQKARADLESLVESTLSQIDELRDDYLSRLTARCGSSSGQRAEK